VPRHPRLSMTTLDPLARRIFALFDELGRDRLDLRALSSFEGGNAPGAGETALEAVVRLVERGWLQEHSGPLYSRTEEGRLQLAGPREITLYTREGCHLCEVAHLAILPLLDEFGAALRMVEIDADPLLRERYGNDVPVVFLAARKLAKHRLDVAVLRRRLAEACPP
jgi:Glutaredoxin-like domain (DUF836)